MENRRKIEPQEIPSRLITRLLVVFTRQLEILVTTLLGIVIFVVMPDQEEIGIIIVALGIGVQLGIKGESERFVVFTRMNLFLEEI